HVEHDDLHEPRAARAYLENFVELLLVLGEEEPAAAVVDDVLDLPRGVGRVDPVRHPAGAERAEIGVEPLRAVVGEDRDHVARAEPEAHETEPDVSDLLAVLAPADRPPDAEVLLAHRRLRPTLARDLAE